MNKISRVVLQVQKPVTSSEQKNFITFQQINNYWPQLRLEELNTKYTWIKELPEKKQNEMGFKVINEVLGLIPIDIKNYYLKLNGVLPKYLVHEGFQCSSHIYETQKIKDDISEFDNDKNLIEFGVWGNPNLNTATFIKPPHSKVVPMSRNGLGTRLYIDIKILQKLKNVFVDPEMYIPSKIKNFEGSENDIPGNSLMVFGGIPKATIVKKETFTMHELK